MWKTLLQRNPVRHNFSNILLQSLFKRQPFRSPKRPVFNRVHAGTFTKCFIFGNGFNILTKFVGGTYSDEFDNLYNESRLTEEVKTACHKNVEALLELMKTLNVCMNEINKEYMATLEKQIELTKQCTELGPLGSHWDELTKYRIQADDLKMEFNKYELLVQKVGQMVFYQAVTSLMSGNENEMDVLNQEYNKLENIVEILTLKHKEIETQLLIGSRESILKTPSTEALKK